MSEVTYKCACQCVFLNLACFNVCALDTVLDSFSIHLVALSVSLSTLVCFGNFSFVSATELNTIDVYIIVKRCAQCYFPIICRHTDRSGLGEAKFSFSSRCTLLLLQGKRWKRWRKKKQKLKSKSYSPTMSVLKSTWEASGRAQLRFHCFGWLVKRFALQIFCIFIEAYWAQSQSLVLVVENLVKFTSIKTSLSTC